MAESTVKVVFLGDSSKLKKELDDVDGSATKAEGGLGKVGGGIAKLGAAVGGLALAGGIASFASTSVEAATALGESVNAVNKIFGDSASEILDWGKNNATQFGLSQAAFNSLATPLGALLKNSGLQNIAGQTVDLTKRAADLASVFNVDVSEAMEAINSGLKGEADPLEKFGIGLSAAKVEAQALSDTGKKLAKDLTDQEKAQARINLIMKESASVAGDFTSTSKEYANAQRIAAAKTEELQAKLGVKLVPVMQQVTKLKLALVTVIVDKLMPAFSHVGRAVAQFTEAFEAARNGGWEAHGIFEKLGVMFAELVGGIRAFVAAFRDGGDEITSSGFAGFLEQLGVISRNVFDWLRANVPPVMAAIMEAAQVAFGWLQDNIPPILETIRSAIEVSIGAIADWWRTHWEDIRAVVELVITVVRTIIETTLAGIEAFWRTWGGTITSVVTGIFDGIRQVIEGVLTVIRGILDVVMGLIRGDWGRAWDGVLQIVSGAWAAINGLIDAAMAYLRALIETAMRLIAGAFDAAWETIKSIISAALDAMYNAARNVLFNILGAFASLGQGIANVVSAIGSTLAGWVNEVWKYGGMVLDFFAEIPGKIGDFFGGLAEAIISPFRSAFNAIAGLWNRTVGSLSFTIPSWVPGIGGNGWDVPDIPTFHTGGIVPGSGDVLSLLKGGEGVFTREQMAAMGRGGGGNTFIINVYGARSPQATADTVQRTLMASQLRVALAGA